MGNVLQFSTHLKSYLQNWEKVSQFSTAYDSLSEIFMTKQPRETMHKALQTSLTENSADQLEEGPSLPNATSVYDDCISANLKSSVLHEKPQPKETLRINLTNLQHQEMLNQTRVKLK